MLIWQTNFETGISQVDMQHKHLVNLTNSLKEEIIAQLGYDNYDKIMEILEELKNYTIDHFKQEEELMKNEMNKITTEEKLAMFWEYFKNHKKEHTSFIVKVNAIFEKDIDDQQAEISVELTEFLMVWLKDHILKVDMEMRKYITN